MPLLLGQLVYTSFPGVGFRVLASTQVPSEIQQAFIHKVVYQHWDSHNPPRSGYRAAYLHQVTLDRTLFGWLYNDGSDDLGRSHVPYFVCYYLAGLVDAVQLENILTCLHSGPVALIDREILPGSLETRVAPDLWSYQPARKGVAIPSGVREYSHVALKQGRLLDVFIPVNEREMVTQHEQSEQQEAEFSIYTSYLVESSETDAPVVVNETKAAAFSEPGFSQGKTRLQIAIFWSLISFVVTLGVGGGILTTSGWTKPCSVKSEKRVWGSCYRDLQAKPLTIGIVNGSPDSDYNALVAYLRNKLGSPVEIDKGTPFGEIQDRIARKDWDIAFTLSPIFSIAAEDKRYIGVAIMFPDQSPYYRAALYVRSNSPIKSIADIKSTTTIALGNPESAPTFHIPIYALYGKSLRVGTGYPPKDVVAMVKAGKVDVGAGRYTAVKDDPTLRMIYVSKAIPGAGVYLSPLLSGTDFKRVKEALLNAPSEIQAKANYGVRQIPNYDELREITSKTETIIECPGFNINSFVSKKTVNLFCNEQARVPNTIEGQVREYKVPTEGNIEFKVVTQKNQIYLVLVSNQILKKIPINPTDILDKFVQVKDVKQRKLADGTWKVKITQQHQLSLLKSLSLE